MLPFCFVSPAELLFHSVLRTTTCLPDPLYNNSQQHSKETCTKGPHHQLFRDPDDDGRYNDTHKAEKDGEIHTFLDFHTKHRRVSIIPVFDITEQSVALNNIYTIAADNTFESQFINKKVRYNLFLFKSKYLYSLFYMLYMAYRYLRKLSGRAYGRLKRQIAGRKLLKQY